MRSNLQRERLIFTAVGVPFILYAALLFAPAMSRGLSFFLEQSVELLKTPFQITICDRTPLSLLLFVGVYLFGMSVWILQSGNYRRREEHGSAKWGDPKKLGKKYGNRKDPMNSKILTQNVSIGLDDRVHRRNLNVLVVGGSGAGKTRSFVRPTLMNGRGSFVVLDPNVSETTDGGAEPYVHPIGEGPKALLQIDERIFKSEENEGEESEILMDEEILDFLRNGKGGNQYEEEFLNPRSEEELEFFLG